MYLFKLNSYFSTALKQSVRKPQKKKKKTTNLGLKIQTLPLISTETEVHKSGQQELGPNATVCLRGVCAL